EMDRVYNDMLGNDDQMCGYWEMDEDAWGGAARDVRDSSGNGSHGLAMNSVNTVSGGISGRAGLFDGYDDAVNLGDVSSLEITGDMTISAWIKSTAASSNLNLIRKWNTSLSQGWMFSIPWGYLKLIYNESSGVNKYVSSNITSYLDGNWHQVASVKSGTNPMKLYVDGTEVSSYSHQDNGSTMTVGTGQYAMLGYPNQYGGPFSGQIDAVRVYNKALSASEIMEIYNREW
ncbi:MAG: LamG domain-containing protein, partial [bacterium]|nr:LamG domain-containing protein [bacterium]